MPRRKFLKRTRVESEAARSIGYDRRACVLQVEFENGGVYNYLDVPESEYEALMAAESIGRFVTYRIKANYRHERVRSPDESIA